MGFGSEDNGGLCDSLTSYATRHFTKTRILSLVELCERCNIWDIVTPKKKKKDSLFT